MIEGWLNFDYFVLFSETEREARSSAYNLPTYLPGFTLVGLRGGDDLIVIDPKGTMCTVRCVPLDVNAAEKFSLPEDLSLEPDERIKGIVKWYLKPLVFGGNLDVKNLACVSLELHADLVVWWNEKYKTAKNKLLLARQTMEATTSAMSGNANESETFDEYYFSKADSIAA